MHKFRAAFSVFAAIAIGGLSCLSVGYGRAVTSLGQLASRNANAAPDAHAGPSLSIYIDSQWQKSRLAQCNSRKGQFQEMGVWVQGNEVPLVDREKWEALSVRQKADVFDIAACIGNTGQVLELMVSVLDRDSGKVLETRRVISDKDFDQSEG